MKAQKIQTWVSVYLNSHEEIRAVLGLESIVPEGFSGIFDLLKLFWGPKLWMVLPHLASQVIVHTLQPLITTFSYCVCPNFQLPHFDSFLKNLQVKTNAPLDFFYPFLFCGFVLTIENWKLITEFSVGKKKKKC